MNPKRNDRIYVFSRAVRSGKTTELMVWLKSKNPAAGLLTPDVRNKRMMYDIASGSYHTFEVDNTYGGDKVTIGKFCFAARAFESARELLLNAVERSYEWLVIDEVGKLEIAQGEGLEPAVLRIVQAYQSGKVGGKLLLVIRDTLLGQAMEKYDLRGAHILHDHLPL